MGEHGQTHAHIYVSGHVQGVYYRATTCDTTRDRGVGGWAESLSDGHVETVFEGPRSDMETVVE